METAVKKTWKPTTAGILNIISGAINAISVIAFIIAITATSNRQFILDAILEVIPPKDLSFAIPLINTILIIIIVLSVIEAVLPIVGGVFAVQRRKWRWALAGSIIAILSVFPLGVLSTIFVAKSKDEFE